MALLLLHSRLNACLAAPLVGLQRCWLSSPSSAYVFHPGVQTMEADVQAYQLTKSLRILERPSVVEELRSSVCVDRFQPLIEKSIIMARNFQLQDDFTPRNYPYGLLQNILKMVFSEGVSVYPTLRNLHVAHNPYTSGAWMHAGEWVAVRGRPGSLLVSRERLPQLYDDSFIDESREYQLEALATNSPFLDLQLYNLSGRTDGEFRENSAFPHLHTMVVIDDQTTPEVQLIQKAILYTFARLSSQAVSRHGSAIIGCPIPEPECAQCIVTNGKRFSFIWYQLNTLDTESAEEGIKNIVCVDRPGRLYSKICRVGGRQKRKIEDLNEDILTTLLSVLLLS